ncbi:hypothetical protein CYLTODRAFT_145567 [Cylindrobasidium torrendii FP15055 ss-10]|uniref:Uncharacterized protein n=1 Tax=Cylindrobasidium torrendii FP15055 ss-10 TaxID=1314674 RepID=A0A0D7AZB4_9AGAR|nr:hypothetical protein CYLTODRAFT_145567 [Cylindrobasidium torrendii FP15055 ss-10]
MAPVPPPQMSLKERIAALQARNATNTSSNVSPQPSSGVLRNKIDAFEKAGFVPVPKGSFGSPTPNPEIQTESRRGELYGNRIPSGKHLEKPLEEQKTGGSVGLTEQRTGGSPAPIREQKTGGSPAPLREQKTGGTFAPLRDDRTTGSPLPVREQKTGGSFGPLREQKTGGSFTPIREQKTGGSFAALDWARAQSQTEEPPAVRGTGRRWSRVSPDKLPST